MGTFPPPALRTRRAGVAPASTASAANDGLSLETTTTSIASPNAPCSSSISVLRWFRRLLSDLEHMAGLVRDIFATPELRNRFDRDTYEILNRTRKAAERWLPVRNCLGGHIDIKIIDELCRSRAWMPVSQPQGCDITLLLGLVQKIGQGTGATRSQRSTTAMTDRPAAKPHLRPAPQQQGTGR